MLDFIKSIPKTETHLHLDGACPFELIQSCYPKKYTSPPDSWAPDFRFKDFGQFIDYCEFYFPEFFCSGYRFELAAQAVFEECARQNVHYVETSFNICLLSETMECPELVLEEMRATAPPGMTVRIFAGMGHNDYYGRTRDLIEDCPSWEGLDGIDLHGFENTPLQPWTARIWARAREMGKYTKVHAGEFMGADFVEKVLDELRPHRIEHGVRAIENMKTVERLKRENIALDVCPISNLKLGVKGVPTLAQHPIRPLFDAGVTVTLSTDDPTIFGNHLNDEYMALYEHMHFTKKELLEVAANGFRVALLPEDIRQKYLAEIAEMAAQVQE